MNDLLYAEKVGAVGSVFHVGKHLKQSVEEGIENMYQFISTVIEQLQNVNSKSIYILETCAACGTELLSDLKDFGQFYHRFTEKQKENLKICIDTCHVFSAGYSLKSESDAIHFTEIVENHIGWKNVILIHLNDSKKDCGCHVDRHENLCMGCIGKEDDSGFRFFVKYCYSLKIPLVLETPHDDHNMYEIYEEELNKIKNWLNN
jgi:deoxyribonuclease-4